MGVFLFLRYLIAGSANDEVADKSAHQCIQPSYEMLLVQKC